MKKTIFAMLLAAWAICAIAQDSTAIKAPQKNYHNEFGLDATGFFRQFLSFNDQQFTSAYLYSPTYYITYRRYFKGGNIRFAIGGNVSTQEINSPYNNDPNKYTQSSSSLNARIGWEFVSELSKRWQAFYGLDFRPAMTNYKNDAQFWNGGYANGLETKSQIYGIAPVLGFRFNITPRLSLLTEASFAINKEYDSQRKYLMPLSSQYPPMPDDGPKKTQKLFTSYGQPISLFIVFKI